MSFPYPNWKLEFRKTYNVNYLVQKPTYNEYNPIAPIIFDSTSTTLLIGGFSESAMPWWYLAGYIEQQGYFSPSFNNPFNKTVLIEESKKVPLGRLAKLTFPNQGYNVYRYSFEPRYYLKDITVELWTPF